MRVSMSPIRISRIIRICDLGSGQIRDLTIIRQWENVQMLPALNKRARTTRFFQNHDIYTHLR